MSLNYNKDVNNNKVQVGDNKGRIIGRKPVKYRNKLLAKTRWLFGFVSMFLSLHLVPVWAWIFISHPHRRCLGVSEFIDHSIGIMIFLILELIIAIVAETCNIIH